MLYNGTRVQHAFLLPFYKNREGWTFRRLHQQMFVSEGGI